MFWNHIQKQISSHIGQSFTIQQRQSVGGGSINQAYKLSDGNNHFFVKTNRRQLHYMFEAESSALDLLFRSKSIKLSIKSSNPITPYVITSAGFLSKVV